jgi:hypothetical protein
MGARSGQRLYPYCGQQIIEDSADHIFPRFIGWTRTSATSKRCNDRFGRASEGRAAVVFQKIHFYLAAKGMPIMIPLVRWEEAFTLDGKAYDDLVIDNGEVRFLLSRPNVHIDKNHAMNSQFGWAFAARLLTRIATSVNPNSFKRTQIRKGIGEIKKRRNSCDVVSASPARPALCI